FISRPGSNTPRSFCFRTSLPFRNETHRDETAKPVSGHLELFDPAARSFAERGRDAAERHYSAGRRLRLWRPRVLRRQGADAEARRHGTRRNPLHAILCRVANLFTVKGGVDHRAIPRALAHHQLSPNSKRKSPVRAGRLSRDQRAIAA